MNWSSSGTLLCAALALASAHVAAQAPAARLDPSKLMQGFPPPPEYRVHIGNWQEYPQKIWSFQHTRELFPTRLIARSGAVWPLPARLLDLDALQVGAPGEAPLTWPQMLAQTHIDAIVVLHQGRIIDERYFNGMTATTPHLMFSATKSMAGLMAATLVAEGRLDANAKVATLLPELADSAWADATVRQVMDMTDGVSFTEIYTDPKSDIFPYIGAMGWDPRLRRTDNPSGIQAMLSTLKTQRDERGTAFRYRSPATDVTAWLAMRAADRSLSQWLQERLWSRLGMERDAFVMLDPVSTEVAFAGMNATARDLARLGQLLLQNGRLGNEQLIPAAVVEDLIRGGDVRAFEAAGFTARKGWSYRSQFWVNPKPPRSFAAMGAFGQRLYVFPDHELVIVMFGSHPSPVSAVVDPVHQRAIAALIAHLERPAPGGKTP
jgi:hypothetical protein